MATRIKKTPFVILAIIVVIALIYFGHSYVTKNPDVAESIVEKAGKKVEAKLNPMNVHIVTYIGMAPGVYFNNGLKPNKNSRYMQEYGLPVTFDINDNILNAVDGWNTGKYDVAVITVDALPALGVDRLAEYGFKTIALTDISQGADVAVGTRAIQTVSDFKNRRVGFVPASPSQFFCLNLLDAAGMNFNDIVPVTFDEVPLVVEAFKARQIDIAFVWAPDDQSCIEAVDGAHVIKSTKESSQMLFGIMYAKEDWIESHSKEYDAFVEGWLIASSELNESGSARQKAANIMAEAYGNIPADFWSLSFDLVRLATYGDNRNFFGLTPGYQGMTADKVYLRAGSMYKAIDMAPKNLPSWRSLSNFSALQSISLTGVAHAAQSMPQFAPPTDKEKALPAIATKTVRVNFATNSDVLTPEFMDLLDREYVDILKMNRNSLFRVEGHTDNTGNYDYNMQLSRRRAKSVVNYFVKQYALSENQFIVNGYGPDIPIADNTSEHGRWLNRRTELKLLSGE